MIVTASVDLVQNGQLSVEKLRYLRWLAKLDVGAA